VWLLSACSVLAFLYEGKTVWKEKRQKTVYFALWIAGLILLTVGVTDSKEVVCDLAETILKQVKEWRIGT